MFQNLAAKELNQSSCNAIEHSYFSFALNFDLMFKQKRHLFHVDLRIVI
jgi:hypothetical protein